MSAPRENVLSAITPLYFDDSSSVDLISDIFLQVEDLQLFALQKSSSLQTIVSYVNNCLNFSHKRLEGLLLLEKLISQSSTLVFTDHINSWIKLLLQILKSPGETVFHKQSCRLLSLILKIVPSFKEVSRDVSINIIPQLLPVLLHSQELYREEAIECFKTCAQAFPGPTGSFRSKIDKLLLSDLQSSAPKSSSASCLAMLGGCGPGGKNRIKHTEGWSSQFTKVYSTLENTLLHLYEPLQHDHIKQKENVGGFQLDVLPDSIAERRHVLLHRLSVFTEVLSCLLTEEFSAVARIQVEDILQFIYKCLEVNGNVLLHRPTTENLLLLSILPRIHQTALQLLQSLILSCKMILVPFTSPINKLLIQTLVWTSTKTQLGYQKLYSSLRIQTYQTIIIWLECVGVSTHLVDEEKDFIDEIITDITPPTDAIKLSTSGIQNSFEPAKKKKKKNYGTEEIIQGMASHRKVDLSANFKLVSTALKALQLLVFHFGSTLKLKTYKDVQESLMSILLEIQNDKESLPIPYSVIDCRVNLYGVLKYCILAPHSQLPSLLQCAITLFNCGQKDHSIMVSAFCKEASAICESIVHPRVPCLRGPNLDTSFLHLNKSTDPENTTDKAADSTTSSPLKRLSELTKQPLSRSKIERTSLEPAEVDKPLINELPNNYVENSESDIDSDIENQNIINIVEIDRTSEISISSETEAIVISESEDINESQEDTKNSKMEIAIHSTVQNQGEEETKIKEGVSNKNISEAQEESEKIKDMVTCFVDAGPDSD